MNNNSTDNLFDDSNVNLNALRQKAYNGRWAEVDEGVIPLTAADPDFPVAKEITQSIIDYLQDGYLSYTPHSGLQSFKESVADYLNTYKNENVDPSLVLPIDSAARGMYIIAESVLDKGDEVIVFDPVDYLFRESSLAAGASISLFPARVVNNRIDLYHLEEYITAKTKMICLCNPHNPLGIVYTPEDLEHILSLANKYDLYIMNDEIWSDIVYKESKFTSILSLGKERNRKTLSVFGFSKSFGVAGLRAGAVYAHDEKIFETIVEKSQVLTTAGGISSLSQIGAQAALDKSRYWVEAFLTHLTANRDYGYERINRMKNLSCLRPQATYMFFVDITKTGLSSTEFTQRLKDEGKLAVVPGVSRFFGPGAEGYVRICFATSAAILREALDRLERWLETL
ncbi:MAG: pyridoxal phosphate-dependent aminotransferase [Sphaerochaetaceae bacterium]|nr:pyridoxal phosphate-dependent aminotransferase [Sphaerochaetaceae bacterium]